MNGKYEGSVVPCSTAIAPLGLEPRADNRGCDAPDTTPRVMVAEVNITPEGVAELMKLFCDTDVMSIDAGEDEEVDVSAIKSLRYETFSLPVEDRIVLEQAIESLTELQRKVVYLFFYKDLSQTEIGRMLSLPQRRISRIVASATRSMRKLYVANRNADNRET